MNEKRVTKWITEWDKSDKIISEWEKVTKLIREKSGKANQWIRKEWESESVNEKRVIESVNEKSDKMKERIRKEWKSEWEMSDKVNPWMIKELQSDRETKSAPSNVNKYHTAPLPY